jgi:hypothetical protein
MTLTLLGFALLAGCSFLLPNSTALLEEHGTDWGDLLAELEIDILNLIELILQIIL